MIAVKQTPYPSSFAVICEICGARHEISPDLVRWRFGQESVETSALQAHLVCSCELTLEAVDPSHQTGD